MCQIMMIISLCTTNGADSHTAKTSPILCADGLMWSSAESEHIIALYRDTVTDCSPVSGGRFSLSAPLSCPSVERDHQSHCVIWMVNLSNIAVTITW